MSEIKGQSYIKLNVLLIKIIIYYDLQYDSTTIIQSASVKLQEKYKMPKRHSTKYSMFGK